MRRIALVLLIVAARAQKPEKIVASVEFIDPDENTVGAINFSQDKSVPAEVSVHCRLWGLPDGAYIAVVHDCAPSENDKHCDSIGLARAKPNQIEDPTKGREPLALFRRQWKNSTDTGFTTTVKTVSLVEDDDNYIIDYIVALYRDTSSGLKLCPKSRKNLSSQKTATPVAWGFVNPELIDADGPMIPEIIDDTKDYGREDKVAE